MVRTFDKANYWIIAVIAEFIFFGSQTDFDFKKN